MGRASTSCCRCGGGSPDHCGEHLGTDEKPLENRAFVRSGRSSTNCFGDDDPERPSENPEKTAGISPRSHALRGNAVRDAPRPPAGLKAATQSVENGIPTRERGNEGAPFPRWGSAKTLGKTGEDASPSLAEDVHRSGLLTPPVAGPKVSRASLPAGATFFRRSPEKTSTLTAHFPTSSPGSTRARAIPGLASVVTAHFPASSSIDPLISLTMPNKSQKWHRTYKIRGLSGHLISFVAAIVAFYQQYSNHSHRSSILPLAQFAL